jgi:hypothetical protein
VKWQTRQSGSPGFPISVHWSRTGATQPQATAAVTPLGDRWHTVAFSELHESNIRFNSDPTEAKFFATDSKPGTCNNLYDLEGVATHERGHTFGLGDLNTDNHPNLTMRGIMPGSVKLTV